MSEAFDVLAARRRAPEKAVKLLLDAGLAERRRRLLHEVNALRGAEGGTEVGNEAHRAAMAKTKELANLNAEVEDAYEVFRFRGLSRKALEDLRLEHPARPVDTSDGFAWNRDSFPPAFLAATCYDPDLTLEDWATIWNEWSEGDVGALFDAAWAVNTDGHVRPFSDPDSGATPSSVESLITAPLGESLTADS